MSVTVCLFVLVFFVRHSNISRERLNGFAPNSQGRRALSIIARMSLNVKVKGRSKVKVTRDKNCMLGHSGPLRRSRGRWGDGSTYAEGGLRAVMLGKTSL